jgi:RimJ/RimL family protein N-acetyltransferase
VTTGVAREPATGSWHRHRRGRIKVPTSSGKGAALYALFDTGTAPVGSFSRFPGKTAISADQSDQKYPLTPRFCRCFVHFSTRAPAELPGGAERASAPGRRFAGVRQRGNLLAPVRMDRLAVGTLQSVMMANLETDRLVLRPFQPEDLGALTVLHAEPSFWWFSLRRGQTAEETTDFLNRQLAQYEQDGLGFHAVIDRASGALAGWAGLAVPAFLPEVLPSVEVGWRLGSAWRQKGYATEAGAAWVRWGFEELRLDRLISVYEPDNVASGRVMEKLGFRLERVAVHPRSGTELYVTELTETTWAGLCETGDWPPRSAKP